MLCAFYTIPHLILIQPYIFILSKRRFRLKINFKVFLNHTVNYERKENRYFLVFCLVHLWLEATKIPTNSFNKTGVLF